MGEYKEKIKKHFWMLVCSSSGKTDNKEVFRETYEPIFKIKSKEAFKLVEDPFWTTLYSLIQEIKDPVELRKQLDPVVQLDVGKIRDHIWQLFIFTASGTCDKNTFRENFEPILKINSKEAVNLVVDHLWTALYSMTRTVKEPKELGRKLEPFIQIDVKCAAEAIKEDNPDKYEFLQVFK
jgi:hypothetical protein